MTNPDAARTLTVRDLASRIRRARRLTILTGAGVSAASGIPTFRGPQGLWRAQLGTHWHNELRSRATAEHAAAAEFEIPISGRDRAGDRFDFAQGDVMVRADDLVDSTGERERPSRLENPAGNGD